MKRKGSLLIGVLILIVVFSIIAIPIALYVGYTSEVVNDYVLENKADEIAYGGYLFMEKYIVDYESEYINYLVDNKYNTEIVIPFGDGSNSMAVNIKTEAVLSGENSLSEVKITATTNYADIDGFYDNTIYFQESGESEVEIDLTGKRPPSIFSYDSYFLYNDATSDYVDGEPGLKTRMGIDTIPEINQEHIDYILNHENTNYVTITTTKKGVARWSLVESAITQLGEQEGKNKPWQVIYIDNISKNNTIVRTDGTYVQTDDTTGSIDDRYTRFDLTGYGNGVDRTNLIFLSDADIQLLPTYKNGLGYKNDFNHYFPDVEMTGISSPIFDLVDCDLYFISFKGEDQKYTVNELFVSASVYSKDNKNFNDLGQITFVSGSDVDKTISAYMGRAINIFVYAPFYDNLKIVQKAETEYSGVKANDINLGYAQPYNSNRRKKLVTNTHSRSYGGIVGEKINLSKVNDYIDEYVSVEWKGDPRLLGYYDLDADYDKPVK